MLRFFAVIITTVVYATFSPAFAESTGNLQALIRQAQAKGLADDPYWHALLHYRKVVQGDDTKLVSEIISPDFFLSAQGATHSSEELTATLTAFFLEPNKNSDNHAQCRFIARYKWLKKSLDWRDTSPPSVTCKQFNAWIGNVESLSLVFATGYLSNPASFYGHLLLKFNTNRAIAPTDLLDNSLNFGAIVPNNENGFIYVVKGLFGGYLSSFSSTHFYRLNHMYAENELRNLWEYELALNADEVDQIASHSWELLRTQFTYYFLKENCAYRMAELLQLVINQPLLSKSIPWSMPATVFNNLNAIERDGTPLVRKVNHIPSRRDRYSAKYLALTSEQKILVERLANEDPNLKNAQYLGMPETEKIAVIDTLLDYYEFRMMEDSENVSLKNSKYKTLLERGHLASNNFFTEDEPAPLTHTAPPHEGPLPGMIRIGYRQNNYLGDGIDFRLRPAYFDMLELDTGRIPNSHLTMFDLRATYANNQLKLRNLELLSIENLNVAQTPLPKDGGLAWKIKLGFESQNMSCEDCLIFNVNGGIGKASPLMSNLVGYGMLDVFAQTKYLDSGIVGITSRIGLITSPINSVKSSLIVEKRQYIDASHNEKRIIRWENRIGKSRDWDIRISYENQVAHELYAGISTYW